MRNIVKVYRVNLTEAAEALIKYFKNPRNFSTDEDEMKEEIKSFFKCINTTLDVSKIVSVDDVVDLEDITDFDDIRDYVPLLPKSFFNVWFDKDNYWTLDGKDYDSFMEAWKK